MGKIIDGRAIAKSIRNDVAQKVNEFVSQNKVTPKLSVILVGEDPASQVYVRNKEKACAEVGITSEVHRFPLSVKQNQVLDLIRVLNEDDSVHGILVQLPLPKNLMVEEIIESISPLKDVDGLHPLNMGRLLKGSNPFFVPCTPSGVIELILSTGVDLVGKRAVVVGRSNIVGKPVSFLLLERHATVTICHSRTQDLDVVTKEADILVVAVGSPGVVHGPMVRDGVVVIDVGVNRLGEKLVGDVDFDSVKDKASFITPVPGGVGPMTIAMLLRNTLKAAQLWATKKAV
ncbi:MAG: bifunctional methylenetetrahydrofolate dehydrogenase/methenyltetrahydrofolate cyclohydrolase FolD [Candidatus Margulisiibacteriota bacterium]